MRSLTCEKGFGEFLRVPFKFHKLHFMHTGGDEMNIGLKCFATLAEADRCDYRNSTSKTLPDGSTVRSLLIQEAIDEKDVKLIFVNGQKASMDTVLKDGDQVGLSPPVGGM